MTSNQRFLDFNEERFVKFRSIDGYEQQTLLSLANIIENLKLAANIDNLLNKTKHLSFHSTDGLTTDEALIIHLYTLEHVNPNASICTQLNQALRSTENENIKPWLPFFKLFITALNKLPTYQGMIYRGVCGNISHRFQNEIYCWGFNSCTENINVMDDLLGRPDVKTIFYIRCINGRSIRNYSSTSEYNEVILAPGTCLHVIGKRTLEEGIHIIDLQEVAGPFQLLSVPHDILSIDENSANDEFERQEQLQSGDKFAKSNILIFPSPHDRVRPDKIPIIMPPTSQSNHKTLDQVIGCLVGLAIGDALGASVEFRSHDFLCNHRVTDMQSGGTWNLKAGQWTDDTSMALCLASSLITRKVFDPYDQLVRYKWWYKHGFLSSTGHCFDIGSATRRALDEFCNRQKILKAHGKYQTIHLVDQLSFQDVQRVPKFDINCSAPNIAGNGCLMRLAPVPVFYFRSPAMAIENAGRSAIITHGDKKAVDACRYYAALIVAAMQQESKDDLLCNEFFEKHEKWFTPRDLHPEILRIAHGSYKRQEGYEDGIRGKGYVVSALEAALWAFWSSQSFETGVLAAIHLGDDTDTTAAIYGQLAGVYYGYNRIPEKWRQKLYAEKFIVCIGHWLYFLGNQY